MCTERPRQSQSGLTLIELIVFIVVVSVGLAGVLAVFNLTVRKSADPLVAKQALAVADAMLEEILLKNFTDPGGPAEAGRQDWDNVDDYNGYGSADAYSLVDLATPVLAGYQVAVAVSQPAVTGVAAGDVRQVSVTVSYGAEAYTLTGYRFNHD